MDGDFTFAPILQGKYEIVASHSFWKFSKNTTSVHLVKGNVHIGVGELVVAGYDVSGLVTSEEEPFEGVSFVLFHTDMVHSQLTSNYVGCDNKSLNGFKTNEKPICHVTSDEKGIFRFLSLPPGRYKVVPHYEGPHSINFDVKPQEMEFTVDHDSLMIDTKFEVKGFSVRGRVAMHPDGPGLEGASILLDGYLKSYTQADGVFLLENMQPGTFTLQIQANVYNAEQLWMFYNLMQDHTLAVKEDKSKGAKRSKERLTTLLC
uniref:Nodal modulator 1 n=1 Tax=Timema bartmani TaxID=61472 RepID=A0A7R9I4Q0_9NEOP|nr:unnamed protein product [Timema bartmani]